MASLHTRLLLVAFGLFLLWSHHDAAMASNQPRTNEVKKESEGLAHIIKQIAAAAVKDKFKRQDDTDLTPDCWPGFDAERVNEPRN